MLKIKQSKIHEAYAQGQKEYSEALQKAIDENFLSRKQKGDLEAGWIDGWSACLSFLKKNGLVIESELVNVCDYNHETKEEIRALPLGGDAYTILCKEHYAHELEHRKKALKQVLPEDLPSWESLRVVHSKESE